MAPNQRLAAPNLLRLFTMRLSSAPLYAAVFSVVSLLSSCANISGDYRFDASKPVGLAVGTITYDTSVGLYAVIATQKTGIPVGEKPRVAYFRVGDSMWTPFTRMHDDGLKVRGGTFAIELPAGTYTLEKWFIKQGYTTYTAKGVIGIDFTVDSQRSTYVGNFHFDEKSEVSLRERSARDLPVLRDRFPILAGAPLAFAVAEGSDIRGIGGEYSTRTQVPALIFVPVR